jgi:hypothetical protein
VDANVGLAPGADDNPLAVWATERISASLDTASLDTARARLGVRRDFFALRCAVALVAPDLAVSATLRFDHGYLTAHDGMIGIPDITFCGDRSVLLALEGIPLSRLGRLPLPPWRRERRDAWRTTMLEILGGELRIYGLVTHPRMALRVVRLLSAGGAGSASPSNGQPTAPG